MSDKTTNKFSLVDLPDVPESVDNALKNISDKPTKVIGEMIADLLKIPAGKIKILSTKKNLQYEQNFIEFVKSIEYKTSSIKDDKIVNPQLQVIGPTIENSSYCLNSQYLSDMFSSLIANCCNFDYAAFMHPSFAFTLSQLSPYDAMLFRELSKHINTSAAQYRKESKLGSDYTILYPCIPFTDAPFDDLKLENVSISSLKHLGLIEYEFDSIHPNALDRFKECKYFQSLLEYYEHQEFKPSAKHCRLSLTPYGESFAIACSLRPNE